MVIKEALGDPDVKIFLRAAEGIALASRDFASSLEVLCTGYQWAENMAVGSYFNSVSALALYNQYKAYADGQQAMLRILKTAPFAQFYRDAELYLSGYPGNFAEKIEQPRQRVNHFMTFLYNLKSCTPTSDADFAPIEVSISALTFVNNEIQELIRVKQNFEKLLSIQNSFISNFLNVDPVLAKLASTDRTFIMEGDLKKVCRKKNKVFHFWLFNDYLMYGGALGAGTYSFNRALDLTTCSVKAHESAETKNALEVFGAEKSFIVIAPSTVAQMEWLNAIKAAKATAMGTTVEALDSAPVEAAPLWVPDSGSSGCTVCKKVRNCICAIWRQLQPDIGDCRRTESQAEMAHNAYSSLFYAHQEFTFWNRRHHCRKCGSLVCSDHLKKTQIIPHIHKTTPQKVCDHCFAGKGPGSVPSGSGKSSTGANVDSPLKSGPAPTSAAYVSAPQAPVQAQAPVSATPATDFLSTASPVKPVRPLSITKPPKPAKTDALPSVQGLSVQEPPAAPQYSPVKPGSAPPPLPSSPPPPVPTSAPPPVPSSAPPPVPPVAPSAANDAANSSSPTLASVIPTRRGSTGM
jgi:hypothetical protein